MTSQESEKIDTLDSLILGGCLILVAYLFYPTLKTIALICWYDDDYSHGLLLPIVAVYMLWDRRQELIKRLVEAKQDRSAKETSWLFPECLLLIGLFIFFIGETSGITYASWLSFFPVTLATIHLIFGRTVFFCASAPLLLLFMAKPLPDSVVVRIFWPLQVLAARVSTKVLEYFDVPVRLVGNIIEIPAMKLLVEEACSGMRSCMALITLALIVNYFIEMRPSFKFLMVLISVAIAVLLNIFRVALTGVLAHFYDPATATGFFHTFSGLIVFVVGLPLLYGCGTLLTKLELSKA